LARTAPRYLGLEMPNLIVCFMLGVVAPLASISWLLAYH
jgi:hypothetical protein